MATTELEVLPVVDGETVVFSETELVLENVSRDRWAEIGETLARAHRASAWWIGDWLRYGQDEGYIPREKYDEVERIIGRLKRSSLHQYAWVADVIESSRRLEDLEFGHHHSVAARPPADQDEWLAMAVSNEWSVGTLRAELRKADYLERQRKNPGEGHGEVHQGSYTSFFSNIDEGFGDLLLTDPPYMTDVADIDDFAADWVPFALSRLADHARAYIFTGAYPRELRAYLNVLYEQDRFEVANVLVWTYRNTIGPASKMDYLDNWQAIFHLRGPTALELDSPELVELFAVHDVNAPDGRHEGRLDAWQKPDELAERFIRHSTAPLQNVLDPFAGTGTFIAAARRLGRIGIGGEIDPKKLKLCEARGLDVIRRG